VRIPIHQVDAFTDRRFAGNPAAVCLLETWLPDATLQAIATENNLSETAFVIPAERDGFELRWFTPAIEVDLCGHATLASAFVLRRLGLWSGEVLRFTTRQSGVLDVRRDGERLELDFPARPPQQTAMNPGLDTALGVPVRALWKAKKWMAVLDDEAAVLAVRPDFAFVKAMDGDGLIVTARGGSVDFVSRYFAPHAGIDEDPVTGSAHCTLVPYWAEVTGKHGLRARQLSQRGGELFCRLDGDRVRMAGHCVPFLVGEIEI
jgi:PhzF family phenazine biosynthesis protein